jgi:hypothetical protein
MRKAFLGFFAVYNTVRLIECPPGILMMLISFRRSARTRYVGPR